MAEDLFKLVTAKLNRLGLELTSKTRKDLQSKGKNASNKLTRSLNHRVVVKSGAISFRWFGASHWGAVDGGRKPSEGGTKGSGKLKSRISKWIKQKGIVPSGNTTHEQLTFLITRKIHEKGYRGTNIFTKNMEKFIPKIEILEPLAQMIGDKLEKDLNELKKA